TAPTPLTLLPPSIENERYWSGCPRTVASSTARVQAGSVPSARASTSKVVLCPTSTMTALTVGKALKYTSPFDGTQGSIVPVAALAGDQMRCTLKPFSVVMSSPRLRKSTQRSPSSLSWSVSHGYEFWSVSSSEYPVSGPEAERTASLDASMISWLAAKVIACSSESCSRVPQSRTMA